MFGKTPDDEVLLMKQVVFGKTIQGAAHIRNNVECQDSHECRILDDGTIVMAVADGHGSSNCPYSSIGANTAVSLFCNIMTKIHNEYSDPEQIPTIDISKAIEQEWKKHIRQTHKTTIKKHRNLSKTRMNLDLIYHLYGTTLLGMMITKNYFFGLQLGDGDICYVNQKGLRKVIEPEKILGIETHSISRKNAWEKALTVLHRFDPEKDLPKMFSLTTDGFANSYKSENDFHIALSDYLKMINEHGMEAVKNNLPDWLRETSSMGCGDDITMLIAYFVNK